MKIRNGFVTNSSSSSFILAYNEEELLNSLWLQLVDKYGEISAGLYLGCIMNFLKESSNIKNNMEEFLNSFHSGMYFILRDNLMYKKEKEGMSSCKAYEFSCSEEGKNIIQKQVIEKEKKLCEAMNKVNTVKKISVPYNYELLNEIEYEIISGLSECIYVIDEH